MVSKYLCIPLSLAETMSHTVGVETTILTIARFVQPWPSAPTSFNVLWLPKVLPLPRMPQISSPHFVFQHCNFVDIWQPCFSFSESGTRTRPACYRVGDFATSNNTHAQDFNSIRSERSDISSYLYLSRHIFLVLCRVLYVVLVVNVARLGVVLVQVHHYSFPTAWRTTEFPFWRSRLLNWRFSLFFLVFCILVVTPLALSLLLSLATSNGRFRWFSDPISLFLYPASNSRRSRNRFISFRTFFALAMIGLYLFVLSYVPVPTSVEASGTLAAYLSRLIVIGTVILGLLSGFGAISSSWQFLPTSEPQYG